MSPRPDPDRGNPGGSGPGSPSPVRGPKQLEALPARSREARQAALRVIADARHNERSIAQSTRALRAAGHRVSRYGVLKYAGAAVERGRGGRLVPTAADRIYRRQLVPSAEGNVWVETRSSRRASLAAQYRNAVKAFLEHRDPEGEGLRRFRGKQVGSLRLLTDLDALEEVGRRRALEELEEEGS